MDKQEQIIAVLKDMFDSDLIYLWNERCDVQRYYDDHIFFMHEFDEIECNIEQRSDESPLEFVERIQQDFRNFDTGADYYVVGIYGYESFNCLDDKSSPFDYDELADAILNDSVDVSDYDELNEIVNPEEDEDE